MNYEALRKQVAEIHQTNSQKVSELLNKDFDLAQLETVIDPESARIYKRIVPRYAELCELDQARGLNDAERCELAVSYASLYPTFGHEGIVIVAAHWLANRPNRLARGH